MSTSSKRSKYSSISFPGGLGPGMSNDDIKNGSFIHNHGAGYKELK